LSAFRPVVSPPPPSNRTYDFPASGSPRAHGVVRMSTRAACAGSELPAVRHLDARERRARIHRRPPPNQPCHELTGPFARWTALPSSPVARDSHYYYGRPPRPGGNSGRCAAQPLRVRSAPPGAPTLTHTPVGRVAAQPLPRGHRRALPQAGPRPRPPAPKTGGRDGLQRNKDRASRQAITAGVGAGDEQRASTTGIGSPTPFCPC
jgi:hypothetical protein